MPIPSALVCVRCGARYPIDRFAEDCPACRPARRAGQSHRRLRLDSGRGPQPRRCGAPAGLDVALGFVPAGRCRRGREPGRGQYAAAGGAVARPRRRLDQGRIAQSHLVVQGPAGLLGAHHGQALRRQGDRLELLRQCRRGGGGLCRQGRLAVRRLHLRRRRAAAGRADARLWRHGGRGREQGRPLAAAVGRRARVRLVSDLAVLRPRGRQQSLWHGRLQDHRLRDRRGVRLAGRPTGACCRSATATRCSACGRASRS